MSDRAAELSTHFALRAFGKVGSDRPRVFDARRLTTYRHPREAPALTLALAVVAITVVGAWMLSWAAGLAIVSLFVLTALLTRLSAAQQLARAAEITSTQFAHLFPLVADLRERFAMPETRVFVTQSPLINAVAAGFQEPYVIVLNSALVEALDEEELKSVIGHEMGHIKFGHTRLGLLLGGLDARGVVLPFPLNVVASVRDLIFLWWQRSTEMTADRAGIIACGRPSKAIAAQVKVSVGPTLFQHVNLADLASQAAVLHRGVARWEGFASQLSASHPFLVNRIEAMLDFVSTLETQEPEQAPGRVQHVAARLVARAPNSRREYPIDSHALLVGRSPSADVRLQDRAASRRHFEVRSDGAGYVISDLGSSNGTFVNGVQVESARLQDRDVIRAGVTELEFQCNNS
ncbi:MAG: M48 family metalloprotease [Chloroflexi bacterium]|nr:M48 family metalloprotease [Chloroflexota bacterium]